MNVVSIEEFASERQFEAHFRSLPRVILEGASDVDLFSSWFEDLLSELDFVAAEDLVGGGGCTAVLPAVVKSRETDGIPAVGIVDRDRLHRAKQWEVLFSLGEKVIAESAEDPDVYTTLLWEVEAYLLRPELLGPWVGAQRNPPPASRHEQDEALARALEECEALLDAVPFFCSAHHVGETCDPRHFVHVSHEALPETCADHLGQAPEERRQFAAEINALVTQIKANAPEQAPARLLFLLRYVDTKRLLARLVRRLGLHQDAHHALSVLMSLSGLRPEELERFLTRTAARFAAN